jgi:hypothetical protein
MKWAADRRGLATHASRRAPRACPATLDRAGVAGLAVRVRVALAVTRLRVGAVAAAHAHVTGLDRPSFLPSDRPSDSCCLHSCPHGATSASRHLSDQPVLGRARPHRSRKPVWAFPSIGSSNPPLRVDTPDRPYWRSGVSRSAFGAGLSRSLEVTFLRVSVPSQSHRYRRSGDLGRSAATRRETPARPTDERLPPLTAPRPRIQTPLASDHAGGQRSNWRSGSTRNRSPGNCSCAHRPKS